MHERAKVVSEGVDLHGGDGRIQAVGKTKNPGILEFLEWWKAFSDGEAGHPIFL